MSMNSETYADVDPVLREIGRLVLNFNSAEHSLRRLAFLLIDADDERIGEITLDRLGAVGLEELVLALVAYRLSNEAEVVKRAGSAVRRFGDVRVRRNNIVHAIWRMPNESTDPEQIEAVHRQFRKGVDTGVSSLSPERIAAVASDASQSMQELGDLYDTVRQALSR
jgi:hypothetical protein